MKKLVKFKCCNTEHLFTRLREFKMCECGKTGYDAGDGYYSRSLGDPNDVQIINQGGYNDSQTE